MGVNNIQCDAEEEIEIVETMEKFGKYQKMQFLYACLPAMFITMIHINYVFVAGDLNYRCRIPECDDKFPVYKPTWWPNATIDRCTRPLTKELNGQSCTNDSFTGAVEVCTEWVYETNNTVIAELNLGCQPWKSNLIGTLHNVGMLIAMIASGWMADSDRNWRPKYRVLSGVLFAYALYMGESVFALIAMFVPYWKNLIRIIYSPPIIFIFLIFLMKESPRWQILNGRTENAKNTLLHVSKVNNININRGKLINMNEEELRKEFKIENYEQKENLKAIFKSKETVKRLLIGAFCKFSSSFVYYGLMVNSVYLPGNKYTNFMLASVMSYPGELLAMYFMNKVGRKLPLIIGYLFCGLLCAASSWAPEDYTWLKIALFLFGKLVISVCYTGLVTYTMELFPTSVRGTLLGICSVSASIGSMFAPLSPILNTVSVVLPPMFFGGTAFISGALLTLTPETKGLPLIDTIEQLDKAQVKVSREEKGEDNDGFNKSVVA